MAKSLTISTISKEFPEGLEFKELRELGIKHISNLSGKIWTDHNLHDPGITILEVLTYGLTDLVYRQNLSIEDLLTPDPSAGKKEDNFFNAAEILTCNPVTIEDFRKTLIDIDGVRNAWLEIAHESEVPVYIKCPNDKDAKEGGNLYTLDRLPENPKDIRPLILNGLYKVYLELETIRPQDKTVDACGEEQIPAGRILKEVNKRLQKHRNLSEDFLETIILEEEQIGLCGEIELVPNADPEEVLIDVFKNVQVFLSPGVPFYTLQQLLDKGKTPTEAFAGRPLIKDGDDLYSHGFIDTDELKNLERKTEIYVSDLYRVIMQDDRVRAIKSLNILNYREGIPLSEGEEWCLKISDRHVPVLSPELSRIKFFKGHLPFSVNFNVIRDRFQEQIASLGKVKLTNEELNSSIPKGKYRSDLGDYYSIQRDLPATYMVGDRQVPSNATPLRKAQANQLKGYLMFFDQLLADYLSQLTHIRDLFSMQQDSKRSPEEKTSVFSARLSNVPHIEDLIQHFEQQELSGQPIAYDPVNYSTPSKRDEALRKTIRDFQQKNVEITLLDLQPGYKYLIKNNNGIILLESVESFKSEKDAMEDAEKNLLLAGESQRYRKLDRPNQKKYSFEYFENPILYFDFIKKIAESPKSYYQRRNQMLDHLLGRFGEEFTDYVLLMYAMNGKQNEPEKIIDDKADFLTNYPEISRNRGRAFDYADKQEIWDTQNVTGLENKVAKLLGIKNAERNHLNNFTVVPRKKQFYFQVLDHRGQRLLVSENGFDTKEEAISNGERFLEWITDLENNPSGENIDCLTEEIYSFRIQADDPRLHVKHPFSYGRTTSVHSIEKSSEAKPEIFSEIRDSKKQCTIDLLAGKGIMTNFEALERGFYFFLYNDDDQLQLISTSNYEEEDLAWKDWLALIELAASKENYRDTTDLLKTGYGFEILIQEGDVVRPLARNPVWFKSKSARTRARKKLISYLQEKQLELKINQGPSSFSWEMKNNRNLVFLQSIPRFKTLAQTTAAYYYLMKIVLQEENYFFFTKIIDEEKQYGFVIGERGEYDELMPDGSKEKMEWRVELATCPILFDSSDERAAYLKILRKQLKKQQDFSSVIFTDHSAWTYELMNDEGESWLQSNAIYPDRRRANQAWKRFLSLAGKRESYQLVEEEGFLKRGVQIIDKEKVVATYPGDDFANEAAAEAFVDQVISFVKSGKAVFADRLSEAYYTGITHPTTGRKIRSVQLFKTKIETLKGYDQLIKRATDICNFKKTGTKKENFAFNLVDENEEVIGVSEQYTYKSERDEAIEDFVDFVCTAPPFFSLMEHPGPFDFSILSEDQTIGMQSTRVFDSEFEARKQAWEFTKLSKTTDRFQDITSENGCQFSFNIQEEEEILAYHPSYYLSQKKRNQEKNEFVNHVKDNCIRFDIAQKLGTWYFEILWENRKGECEVLLRDSVQYSAMFEAQEAFDDFWQGVLKSDIDDLFDLEKIANKDSYTFHFAINNDKNGYMLNHQSTYEKEATCKAVIQDAINYFNHAKKQQLPSTEVGEVTPDADENSTDKEEMPISDRVDVWENDKGVKLLSEGESWTVPNNEDESEEDENKRYGFRLTSGKEPIAIHPFRYPNPGERNAIYDTLLKTPKYSAIKFNGVTGHSAKGFYFLIIENGKSGKTLWQSSEYYGTRSEANEGFELSFLNIISRSKQKKAYQVQSTNDGFQLQLFDENDSVIAIHPICFTKKSEADLMAQSCRQWALIYPIVQKNKYFGFQIYNTKKRKLDWQSKRLFLSFEQAMESFRKFLALQSYNGNYRFIDQPEPCIFGLELGETLLESEKIFTNEEKAWTGEGSKECHGLKDLLRAIQEENGIYPYFDPHQDCRFSFNVVHPSYRLLKHTKSYLTPADREQARDHLFLQYQCGNIKCTDVKIDAACVRMDFYGTIKTDDLEATILWRGTNPFSDIESAASEMQSLYLQIMGLAREFDYYVIYEKENTIHLTLVDDKNNSLAVIPETFKDMDTARKAIYKRMLFARQYPYTQTKEGVKIELYCNTSNPTSQEAEAKSLSNYCPPEEPAVEVPGTIVWKSIDDYLSVESAKCDLEIVKEILNNKENYQRPDADDCGPFMIELVNPKRVLACHPRYYINRSDLDKGIQHTLKFVNREGFHLVEHILLRPREGSAAEVNNLLSEIPLCLEQELCDCVDWETTETDEQTLIENYLPGADPFSFWVSIIIPFWPKRFQSQNFRAFFEETIRKELPAHIGARICWVSPQQLDQFEDHYKEWLSALSGKAACDLVEAQYNVVKELFEMRNVYDPAVLHSCDAEFASNEVYLDQTKL